MKKIRIASLIGIFILLMGMVPSVFAAPPPGDWVSGIACQNLSTTEAANVTLAFYAQDNGTAVLTYVDPNPIDAGKSRNYYTPNFNTSPNNLPADFLGSVVVSSNTQMACNVNTQLAFSASLGTTADNPFRVGTSSGFDSTETSPVMYVPQVLKITGSWSSYIAVQNATAGDVEVTVSYKDRTGADITAAAETVTIPGNSNHVFYQADNANLPGNFLGSAKVASTGGTAGLAVAVNYYNNGANNTTSQLHAYNGFAAGAAKLFVPRFVRNYYGYNGGLSIQNVGTVATAVKVTFTFPNADGTGTVDYVYTTPADVAVGAAAFLYAPDVTELADIDTLPIGKRTGSAVIEAVAAGGEVVAIANEDNRTGYPNFPGFIGQGSSYNAVPATAEVAASQTVFFPQVASQAGSATFGFFSGGFQVANQTGTAGTCTISYNGDTDANESNVALPANGSFSRYAPNVANLNVGYNGSVSVTCTVPVIGISNLSERSGRLGDSFTQSTGLNQ